MLKHRLRSGFLMGGALIAAAMFAPPWAAVSIVAVLGALALWEYYALLDAAEHPSFRIVGTLCGLLIVVAPAAGEVRGMDLGLLSLFVGAFAVFIRMFWRRTTARWMDMLSGTLLGLIYVAFLMSFFVRVLRFGDTIHGEGRWLLLYAIVVVKCCDIGAYFTGCAFGRHKLIPHISPGKSWEGLVGGVATSLAVSLGAFFLFDGRVGPVTLRLADAVALGLLLAGMGVVGDLAESVLKRAVGVKDSGRMIAGMGGLLDVLDSLLLAIPALYFYARLFLEPWAPVTGASALVLPL